MDIGRWKISCDKQATAEGYSKISTGSPEKCGCENCFNYIKARSLIYTGAFQELLGNLGIDPYKEAEVFCTSEPEGGKQCYGGFFYFIGSVKEHFSLGDKLRCLLRLPLKQKTIKMANGVEILFGGDQGLVPDSMSGEQVGRLEFYVIVPWLLDTPPAN